MADRSSINQQFVRECFDYVEGDLIWRVRPPHHFVSAAAHRVFNSRQAGTLAGTLISGYRMVNFAGRRMSVHRLVFLLHNGYLPQEVDHINGNPLDNRIENLRAATHAQNCKNRRLYASNTSGVKGVSFHKPTGKWAAGIRAGGKWKHLGLFADLESAALRRRQAEKTHFGDFANER